MQTDGGWKTAGVQSECWSSVGVEAVVARVTAIVLFASLCAAVGRGIFRAGCVRRHAFFLALSSLEQTWVSWVHRFNRGGFHPGVLPRLFRLVLEQRLTLGIQEWWGGMEAWVHRWGRRRRGWGRDGSEPAETRPRFTVVWVIKVLRWGSSWAPRSCVGTRDRPGSEGAFRVVAQRVVWGCLNRKRLVEVVGSVFALECVEVEAVWRHPLLAGQVIAAVRAGGRVFGALLGHADRLTAEETTLRQGAHVLIRQVWLVWVTTSWEELLALGWGRRKAVWIKRCIEPTWGNKRGQRSSSTDKTSSEMLICYRFYQVIGQFFPM